MSEASYLEIVPLGGLGEFGMNLTVYRWGADCIVVDAGMMFPTGNLPGIDFVVPDLAFLEHAGRLHGVVLTHAHEDHVGAVPHLLGRFDAPVWGTDYTLELVRQRLRARKFAGSAELRRLPVSPLSVRLGPFCIEAVAVTHSIPGSRLLVIDTPVGRVVHSGDFKLDQHEPAGEATDLRRLVELGRQGVVALLSDSTNAQRPGTTPGEVSVEQGLDDVLRRAAGRVVLTTFASNVARIATLGRLAPRHGRRLALLGAAVNLHADTAQQLGWLDFPAGVRIAGEKLTELPRAAVLAVAGGSQGEPLSGMARIAAGQHRDLVLAAGDTVIHSARIIPGNEKPIGRMIDRLLRLGVDVITAADAPVHVSGHACAAELRQLIEWLQPRWFVPLHGEYAQLRAHAGIAADAGLGPSRCLLAEDGDRIRVGPDTFGIVGRAPVGRTYMDAAGDEVAWALIRDRRRGAKDGVLVAVVDIDPQTGVIRGYPEIVARGFTPGIDTGGDLLQQSRRAILEALDEAPGAESDDAEALRKRIELHLSRGIRRATQREPLVITVVRFS